MVRKEHNYHYIYKTTCNVTGRYYIGMHSTSNLEDGYTGSGRLVCQSINEHGKDNHSVEILEWLPDRYSLKLRETEIVNEDLLSDEMCMNLQLGGGGGCTKEIQFIWSSAGGKSSTGFTGKKHSVESKQKMKEKSLGKARFKGRQHTAETKERLRNVDRTGIKNSQFGTQWITNSIENMKIKKGELIPAGWKLGRRLR